MLKSFLTSFFDWARSIAGITVLGSIIIAVVAAYFRGPYLLVNTIVTGGMLALVSMGLALVFGVMNIPMFAHGEYFMIGGLTAYYFITPLQEWLGQNPSAFLAAFGPLIAIFLAGLVGMVAGAITEAIIFRPLRNRSRENWVMNAFLLTVGLSVVLMNAHQLIFGSEFKGIVRYWSGPPVNTADLFSLKIGELSLWTFPDVFISLDRVLAFVISIVVIILFWLFMRYTNTGRAIRAVSQDETGALMVGIGLPGILMLTMALACGLASVAGASLLFMYPSYPTVGLEPLYMAWFVVIIVGLGNTMGALVGGFIVALLKVLTVEFIGAGWDFVIPSAAITLILIFKPSGIFGSEVRGVLDQ